MLKSHFYKYRKYLKKPISTEVFNDTIFYLSKGWYLLILKKFGIVFALILLKYYEDVENYLICDKIKESIEDSNKHFGTNYKLDINEYGNMP